MNETRRIAIPPAAEDRQAAWRSYAPGRMRDVVVVDYNAVLFSGAQAAQEGVPFSLVRIGDRTLAIVEYPSTGFGDPNVETADFPPRWRIDDATIRAFRPQMREAYAEADAVGVITFVGYEDHDAARAAALDRLLDGIPRAVTTALDWRYEPGPDRLQVLAELMRGRRVICLGRQSQSCIAPLGRLGAASVIAWPQPEQPASITTWARYAEVSQWVMETAKPGDVALVGVGPWSRPFCRDLQRVGAVALDVGSALWRLKDFIP